MVLINDYRKEYFEIPWASLRAMVEPSFAERSLIDHGDYFVNGQIVTSLAVDITETGVLTEDGNLFPYDYLVIATGHRDSVPRGRTERIVQYQEGEHASHLVGFSSLFLWIS